jgi:hypothetical protein
VEAGPSGIEVGLAMSATAPPESLMLGLRRHTFYKYYSRETTAPCPVLVVGGVREASNYLFEQSVHVTRLLLFAKLLSFSLAFFPLVLCDLRLFPISVVLFGAFDGKF